MYTSQDFIAENPRISFGLAEKILSSHGYTVGEYSQDAHGIDATSVDSADMIGWMGY